MPTPQWAEYLDDLAAYLDLAKAAISGGHAPPAGAHLARPAGPPPSEELALRALELLAELESCILDAERRRGEIVQARRALGARAATRRPPALVHEAL